MPGAGFARLPASASSRRRHRPRIGRLLNARARMSATGKRAADPHWLQLEARSDLLDERFDPAIDILDRLLAAGPPPPACWWTMRPLTSSAAQPPAAKTIALRSRIPSPRRRVAPGDPVVLFNEAVSWRSRPGDERRRDLEPLPALRTRLPLAGRGRAAAGSGTELNQLKSHRAGWSSIWPRPGHARPGADAGCRSMTGIRQANLA